MKSSSLGTVMVVALAGAVGVAWVGCGGSDANLPGDPSGPGGSGGAGGGTGGGGTGGATTTTTTTTTGPGAGGGDPCGPGATLCNGACTVTDLDPQNCGMCDVACQPGEVCSVGQCGLSCVGGTTQCGTLCVDTNNDPANCGGCGTTCAAGEVCSSGVCGVTCLGGTTQCGPLCVDTNNDPANCGGCDVICAPGELCSMGQCGVTCLGGATLCGALCVDTNNDPAHCGNCATVCGAGEVCAMGVCTTGGGCGVGLTSCNGACVNTQLDEQNCGSCGVVCQAGANCIGGACVSCNSATTDCDGDGWLVSDGDCCDAPGLCGAEPAKVNPGALEVVGNGIDDNCNGLTDLFDSADTVACDANLASDSADPVDYAKAMGICRQTTANPPLSQRTWGLLSAQLLRADGSALGDVRARTLRPAFGSVNPPTTEGARIVVLSSGIAADGTQTNPGPNGGAPGGGNVSTSHMPSSNVNIGVAGMQYSVNDWYALPNLPLKPANGLPDSPGCNASNVTAAQDSVMLVLRLRAPTNASAFSFNSYFMSAEYPEYVCTNFNDQFVALVDTPTGVPSPIPNPVDKNLMTYTSMGQKWPIGINIAKGTNLFSVCETQAQNPTCWDTDVSATSCSLGIMQLMGTGFEAPAASNCTIGGGTFWLTTAGNVIPGQIVELRIALWDVGDSAFDSLALLDGFQWLANATLPGTGG